VVEKDLEGRRYRRRQKTVEKPREEWVAVPVVDSGIPREVVDTAREAIKDNRRNSSAGNRFWPLSGGILHCACCGGRMVTNNVVKRPGSKKPFAYYRCYTQQHRGKDACPGGRHHSADRIEDVVWEFVSTLLRDRDRLREGLERMVEGEREGLRQAPGQEAKTWLDRLAEVDRKRSNFQDMAAEGLISFDELRAKLAELGETWEAAKRELEALRRRQARIEEIERDRDVLLGYYAGMIPEVLNDLIPEERQRIYKMLKLKVGAHADDTLEVSGALRGSPRVCRSESSSALSTSPPT
jgi:site-specific DNA recombinase